VTPYYSDELVTIYHGDCRDALEGLDAATVDLLLTDPPYGMQFSSGQRLVNPLGNVKADGARQGMRLVRQMLMAATDALKPDAHAYIMCHFESWPDFYDAVSSYMPIRNALIWWKNRGGMGDTSMEYSRDYEVILYAAMGRRSLAGKRDGSVIAGIPPVGSDRKHPTEKPVALMSRLIQKSCPLDGLVLDPFMGAGSTLVAAKALGIRAIGVEIEEKFCEAAVQRLGQQGLWTEPAA
jgi:site-specific DNA-methyltransferase (adenine-specific)